MNGCLLWARDNLYYEMDVKLLWSSSSTPHGQCMKCRTTKLLWDNIWEQRFINCSKSAVKSFFWGYCHFFLQLGKKQKETSTEIHC